MYVRMYICIYKWYVVRYTTRRYTLIHLTNTNQMAYLSVNCLNVWHKTCIMYVFKWWRVHQTWWDCLSNTTYQYIVICMFYVDCTHYEDGRIFSTLLMHIRMENIFIYEQMTCSPVLEAIQRVNMQIRELCMII